MIKKEEEVEERRYFCLNPYCTDNLNRNFSISHRHYNIDQCRKWIVKREQLISQQLQPYNLKSLDNLVLDFDKNPIEAAKVLQRLKISDWSKWLSTQQSKLKKQVCNAIEVEFQALKVKIEQLIQKYSFINDLKQITTRVIEPSDLINHYYQTKNIEFQSMKNHILFKKVQIKERLKSIKSQVQKIYSSMMEEKSEINKLLTYQEQRQYHQYIFQKTDTYFNKLQVLAASLNTKMVSYSIQNQKLSLQCLVCNRKMHSNINPSNKKPVKKYLAEQILIHLYCQHYEQVGFAYSRKIAKTNVIDITFQQFLQESKHFQTVKLIDRQSGPAFEQSYNFYKGSPDTYIIQIISLKNIHMTKGKHIIVSVHESIDLMIAIISYICTQRGQNIEVESKKESLKNGLAQILYLKGEGKRSKKQKKEQI